MKAKYPSIETIARLVRAIKRDISDEYRAFEDDEIPGIQLTVGCDPETGGWSYQTGDNSYSGPAYFYHYWGVAGIYRRSNSRKVAKQIIDEIAENACFDFPE